MYNPQIRRADSFSLHCWTGDYHAFEATIRKQFSSGIQFDLNYTLSKCMDLDPPASPMGPTVPRALVSV